MQEVNEEIRNFLKKGFKKAQNMFWEQEKIRKEFVNKYSIATIYNLELDEYVIGKGGENKSFCYCLENGLKNYGGIHGSGAIKFGVYYSKKNKKNITSKIWSENFNVDEAFGAIKQEIISLIKAGAEDDFETIKNSKISQMFKTKILSTYYPEKYICIFSLEHIDHFCRMLGVMTKKLSAIEKNVSIVKYKKTNDLTKEWSNFIFQRFLYYWKDPWITENTYTEEQYENYLFAEDIHAGHIYKERMVKSRKVNQKILTDLKKKYGECCQICGKVYDKKYGKFVVEGHHIDYFSKSENNNANNIILLCPNHHRIIHKLNPEFDREKLVFRYKNGYEDKILLDKHLNKN